jgi:hypothetical protein
MLLAIVLGRDWQPTLSEVSSGTHSPPPPSLTSIPQPSSALLCIVTEICTPQKDGWLVGPHSQLFPWLQRYLIQATSVYLSLNLIST